MLQRIQTIYLLAVVLIAGMLYSINPIFFTEKGLVNTENQEANMFVDTHYLHTYLNSHEMLPNKGIEIFLLAIGILAFVSIFLFKKRNVQLVMVMLNYVLILCLFANMYWYSLGMEYTDSESVKSFLPAAISPVALLIFNFLARRGIAKDEKLIKSLDRLR
jgi:hypothetical protein